MTERRKLFLFALVFLVMGLSSLYMLVQAQVETPDAQLSQIDQTMPKGTTAQALHDNFLRETRTSTKNTVGKEHYLNDGRHNFAQGSKGDKTAAIGTPAKGNVYMNASLGGMEFYLPSGGVTYKAGQYTATAGASSVTGSATSWLTNILPGMRATLKSGATTYTITKVVSDTSLNITPVITAGDAEAVGAAYSIVLVNSSDQWHHWGSLFFHQGIGGDNGEHYPNGTHRFPFAKWAYAQPGNVWIENGSLQHIDAGGAQAPITVTAGPHAILTLYEKDGIVSRAGTGYGVTEGTTQYTHKVYLPSGFNTLRWMASNSSAVATFSTIELRVDGSIISEVSGSVGVSYEWLTGTNVDLTAVAGRPKWAEIRFRIKSNNGAVTVYMYGASLYLEK